VPGPGAAGLSHLITYTRAFYLCGRAQKQQQLAFHLYQLGVTAAHSLVLRSSTRIRFRAATFVYTTAHTQGQQRQQNSNITY
jgi:hypothetical protein